MRPADTLRDLARMWEDWARSRSCIAPCARLPAPMFAPIAAVVMPSLAAISLALGALGLVDLLDAARGSHPVWYVRLVSLVSPEHQGHAIHRGGT